MAESVGSMETPIGVNYVNEDSGSQECSIGVYYSTKSRGSMVSPIAVFLPPDIYHSNVYYEAEGVGKPQLGFIMRLKVVDVWMESPIGVYYEAEGSDSIETPIGVYYESEGSGGMESPKRVYY